MGGGARKKPKPAQLNPNWIQLQQKLKIHGSDASTPFKNSETETPNSVLGKRKDRQDEESNDCEINPLTPVNDDSSVTDAVAMDCEMVGVGQGNRSALGRVTLVNRWGNVIYDEFVRPVERVVDFRTKISGIRPRDLRKAKDFLAVQKKVAELIKGRILVGHALHNDLKALLLSHPKKDIRDTSEYQPFLKSHSRRALRHLAAEYLGAKIQTREHCPKDDARAAMLLYQRNRKEWEKSVKDQIRLKQKQKKRRPKKKRKKEVSPDGTAGGEYSWTYMRADFEGLIEIWKLCEAGRLKIPVDKAFPITQVKDAHEAKDKKIIPGKVVLELS